MSEQAAAPGLPRMRPALHILTLGVDDLSRALAFYRDGLGLSAPELKEGDDHVALSLQGNLSLVLYPRAELARATRQPESVKGPPAAILSHAVATREEVDAILQRARSAGGTVPVPASEQPWGYFGYFQDPDGHTWEVLWHPELATGA
ncbi:VOC family protein [Myxococcus sp. Y35]|uniref:VOC family protein n=1 Tax=Pseudomyxococcus flavus TaxID=3115648 RepID=UPI003CF820B6